METRREHKQESTVEQNRPDLAGQVGARSAARTRPAAGRLGKAVNIVGNFLFALMLLIMAVLVFSLVQSRLVGGPPSVAGYQMYIVQGGSMSPTFEAGSLAFLKPVDPRQISVGDIITYRSPADRSSLTTHRVVEINREGTSLSFTTRGDANDVNDQQPVYPENVVGEVVYTLPYLGYLMNFGQTRTGVLALVIVPGILIIIFEIKNLLYYAGQWEKEKQEKAKQAAGPDINSGHSVSKGEGS